MTGVPDGWITPIPATIIQMTNPAWARPSSRVKGYALALSNDSSYWRVPTRPRATVDSAFRLHEASTLTGELGWAPSAGAGTIRGREKLHILQGHYPLRWRDYSRVVDGPAGTFRYLLVEVEYPGELTGPTFGPDFSPDWSRPYGVTANVQFGLPFGLYCAS